MDEIRESESIIEELEDICNRNEYIVNLLSELKNNIISRDEEIKNLRNEKIELKDAYVETFEKYIPVNKLSEANEFLLSRFKDDEASKVIVDRKEALKEIT